MRDQRFRLGVIGCGRMAQDFYLPVCRDRSDVVVTSLVDIDVGRARTLAAQFGVAGATDRADEIIDRVDGVVILLPHHLHVAAAMPFLERGIAVLCEKPLAPSLAEAERMVEISTRAGATLEVSLMRRFYPSAVMARRVIVAGLLGRLRSVDVEEGFIARRPAGAGWLFAKDQAGGGVLISNAIHALDLVLWWIGGTAALLDYCDDGFSGVEANARLTAEVRSTETIRARFEYSLMRGLRNTIRVTGDKGSLEVPMQRSNQATIRLSQDTDGAEQLLGQLVSAAELEPEVTYFAHQLSQFVAHARDRVVGFVSGDHHLEAMRLISAAYATRRPRLRRWERHGLGAVGADAVEDA